MRNTWRVAKGVRVQLLGAVRAWREGKEVELRGVSSRSVLARLALSPGTAVSIDTLTEALWGDDAPPNATGNLQASISRLRRGLAPGYARRIVAGEGPHQHTGEVAEAHRQDRLPDRDRQ